MKTTASMFTGGGLFDIGATQAGYKPIWGMEYDDKIAQVARNNGFPVITQDVTKVTKSMFKKMERPDHLHASPPCPNFSIAKTNSGETEMDIAMADSVCLAISIFKPDTFTLENVTAYVNSRSFETIVKTLHNLGYFVDWQNVNSANFGVPQTRNRLWIRASKGLMMMYPEPVKWVGWYESIEDLIDELPLSEFYPSQLAKLPKKYRDFIIGVGERSQPKEKEVPVDTITANRNQDGIHAFIVNVKDPHGETQEFTVREQYEPYYTILASATEARAKAYVGRVVKMTTKALGRFQTVPDWYQGLTIKINGNGVPCKLAKAVLETL
jgi:DNA (cytosine-5)-methyltransferase 1